MYVFFDFAQVLTGNAPCSAHLVGEMFRANLLLIAQNLATLNNAAQLTRVAGPGIAQQEFHRFFADTKRLRVIDRVHAQKMRYQGFDVLWPIS